MPYWTQPHLGGRHGPLKYITNSFLLHGSPSIELKDRQTLPRSEVRAFLPFSISFRTADLLWSFWTELTKAEVTKTRTVAILPMVEAGHSFTKTLISLKILAFLLFSRSGSSGPPRSPQPPSHSQGLPLPTGELFQVTSLWRSQAFWDHSAAAG